MRNSIDANVVMKSAEAQVKSLAKRYHAFLCEDDINEIVQQVSFKVYLNAHEYNPSIAKVSTWVSAITFHTLCTFLKKRNIWQNRHIDADSIDWTRRKNYSVSPFYSQDAREDLEAIFEFTETLNYINRKIFWMMVDGASRKEIAQECDMTEGSVNTCICRLRKSLKALLAHRDSLYENRQCA